MIMLKMKKNELCKNGKSIASTPLPVMNESEVAGIIAFVVAISAAAF